MNFPEGEPRLRFDLTKSVLYMFLDKSLMSLISNDLSKWRMTMHGLRAESSNQLPYFPHSLCIVCRLIKM